MGDDRLGVGRAEEGREKRKKKDERREYDVAISSELSDAENTIKLLMMLIMMMF
jgi:hypothetical protein